MKISLDKDSKLKKKYKVFVSKKEVEEKNDKLLNDKLPTLKIDGFRKGHVPINIAKQHFGASFFKSSISGFIDDAVKQVLEENKFSLATRPAFEENGEIEPDKDFSFFLVFELWPEIPEIKYSKISVTKPLVKMTEQEINEQLSIMADRLAKLEKIEDLEHKSKLKDVLDIDYSGKIDNILFAGGTATNQMLELGSNSFIPGFEEQLVGYKVHDEVVVSVKFPDDYHSEELKGKDAKFDVKINHIHKKVSPEINDDLAKELKEESLENLKEKIKNRASEEYISALKSILRPRVIEQIVNDNNFDLPESILAKENEERKNALIKENQSKPEKEQLSEKEINKKASVDSEKGLRMAYLKNYWNEKYKIEVTNSDFEREVIEEAMQNGIDGSGKTTQIDRLAGFFSNLNKPTLITSEPAKYGTMGDAIYNIIKQNKESTPICDLFLVYTLRNLHVKNVIKPAIKEGKMVICGRYIDSSIAYYARSIEKYQNAVDTVLALHKIATDDLMPNLTFLLDLPASLASLRIAERKGIDKFDSMKVEKMEQIRQVFLKNAVSEIASSRTFVLDGTQNEDSIFSDILEIISKLI
ncbi:unnamed protein product [Rotaria magnacalcarata]|uniref:Uncharacterized protein n=1 Tax=Rotaria magnacalcarata TaxID=392030 RepID=A0A816FI28_9BILA|nr:unnamed protein product [Rotaria magnacalcarata]CAF3788769.1 unnamed protein product [Rotaria magnacalcarata]